MEENEVEKPKPSSTIKVKLTVPIQFGKEELIEELELRPTARAFKEFSLPMGADGKMFYEPYALASVGVRMAGRPNMLVDKLSVADMNAVARVVMDFLA